jgi:ABC-2 type transport system permease protein
MSVVLDRGRKGRHTARPGRTLFALVSHTVRMQLRGVIIWGAALGLYSAAMVASFTAIEGSAAQLNQLMEAYPKGMLEAFGVTDLGDPANYLHSQVFGLAPLALSFFPILALANAIAGAEERGTIDVLLGNPLPRWQVVAGNFVAVAVSLFGICAIVGLLTWGTAALVDVELSLREVAEAVVNLWPICTVFGALALLCWHSSTAEVSP